MQPPTITNKLVTTTYHWHGSPLPPTNYLQWPIAIKKSRDDQRLRWPKMANDQDEPLPPTTTQRNLTMYDNDPLLLRNLL